jgi:hypothetical protein
LPRADQRPNAVAAICSRSLGVRLIRHARDFARELQRPD